MWRRGLAGTTSIAIAASLIGCCYPGSPYCQTGPGFTSYNPTPGGNYAYYPGLTYPPDCPGCETAHPAAGHAPTISPPHQSAVPTLAPTPQATPSPTPAGAEASGASWQSSIPPGD